MAGEMGEPSSDPIYGVSAARGPQSSLWDDPHFAHEGRGALRDGCAKVMQFVNMTLKLALILEPRYRGTTLVQLCCEQRAGEVK